jgi:hypothetical protein
VDSVRSGSDDAGLATASPAAPDAGISEIGELIVAEHARILRLFGARALAVTEAAAADHNDIREAVDRPGFSRWALHGGGR